MIETETVKESWGSTYWPDKEGNDGVRKSQRLKFIDRWVRGPQNAVKETRRKKEPSQEWGWWETEWCLGY